MDPFFSIFLLLQYLNYMVPQLWPVGYMVVVTLHRLSCQCSSSEDIQLQLNSYSNLPIFSHVIHFHDEVSLYLNPQNFTLHLNSDSAFGVYYVDAHPQITSLPAAL